MSSIFLSPSVVFFRTFDKQYVSVSQISGKLVIFIRIFSFLPEYCIVIVNFVKYCYADKITKICSYSERLFLP